MFLYISDSVPPLIIREISGFDMDSMDMYRVYFVVVYMFQAEVLREIDGGAQRVSVDLPAVISADLRLNEPRFATLQNIMKARKKKIEEIPIADLGVDIESMLEYVEINEPPKRKGGVMVDSVEELFEKLKAHECV